MWLTSKSMLALSLATVGLWTSGCQSERLELESPTQAKPTHASPGSTGPGESAAADTAGGSDSNSAPTQAVEQLWREQFEQVQAGQSENLLVDQAPITAAQLAELPALKGRLTQLMVDAGGVSDATLDSISQLQSLVHLRLRECPISDQGLEKLAAAGLPELQILNIPHGKITAAGIVHLLAFPKLTQLRLGGSQIDDRAIDEIARLPKLRSLHLIGPNLSDAALSKLSNVSQLGSFYLDDCRLSDAAWEQLFRAKPNLHVHVDQAHLDRDPNRH
jgi:hypothetical protein